MKKSFVFAVLFITLSLSAFGQFKFGAGLTSDLDDGLIGITAKGHYVATDEYAGQASFSYFFEKNNVTFWTLDFDLHYRGANIGDLEGFSLTPFGGLHFSHANVDVPGIGGASDSEIGINLGIQGLIPLTDDLDLFIEPKFVIAGIDGIVLSAGVYF